MNYEYEHLKIVIKRVYSGFGTCPLERAEFLLYFNQYFGINKELSNISLIKKTRIDIVVMELSYIIVKRIWYTLRKLRNDHLVRRQL